MEVFLRRDIMKRIIILLCVVAFIVALPLSHVAVAGKGPAPKVNICHKPQYVGSLGGVDYYAGNIISVSENALDAHIAHGDSDEFNIATVDDFWVATLANNGIVVEVGDCWVYD
jgi:hypothetical protein